MLAVAELFAVAGLSLEFDAGDFVGAALAQDFRLDFLAQSRFANLNFFAIGDQQGFSSSAAPSAPASFSTLILSFSLTRYCFPPVLTTANLLILVKLMILVILAEIARFVKSGIWGYRKSAFRPN